MKKTYSLFVLTFFSINILLAQNTLNTSGGNATGGSGSVSYSVGEVLYTFNNSNTGSVCQGIQQSYDFEIVSSIKGAENIDLTMVVFPNPTNSYLQLKLNNFDINDLEYKVYDLSGKMLLAAKVKANVNVINLSSFKPATYILKLVKFDQVIKEFKIIKK
jgi:hypothetical protein